MRLQRTVETAGSPDAVFAYLGDFTTTTQWDPGTVETTCVSGDGGVGLRAAFGQPTGGTHWPLLGPSSSGRPAGSTFSFRARTYN